MCGLNGIFAYRAEAAPPSREELIMSRDHMAPRGPDGCGEWWDKTERLGLGHRRLAIIELTDLGHQPMEDDQENVIVFNGEIYNFREIRSELKKRGFHFRSDSDTEVLLKAYQYYGRDFLKHLRGMYALALWDQKKQSLLLARDPFGIKPLYIHDCGTTLRFSSQVKSLLAGRAIPREIDEAGLVGFFLFGSVPEPFTIIKNIKSVPAGHSILFSIDGPNEEPKPFCLVADELARLEKKPVSQTELDSEVSKAVRDSIRAHFIADVDVGVFLSAGVDSCALLGASRQSHGQELQAVTLGFDSFENTSDDEVPWASKVADLYGAKHHIARITQSDFDQNLESIFASMDQPSIDGLNTWFVAKAAREAGLKVAISGLGGDELLAGYPGFKTIPRLHLIGRAINAFPLGRNIAQSFISISRLARTKPKLHGLPCYGGSFDGAYLLYRALFLVDELDQFIDPMALREGIETLSAHWAQSQQNCVLPSSSNSRISALEYVTYTQSQLLRDADWAGMAQSIEIRTPLLDIELLREVGPFLPKIKNKQGKAALAATPSTALPEQLVKRPKTGFVVPTAKWMNNALPVNERSGTNDSISKGQASRNWAKFVAEKYKRSLEALV